MIDEIIASIVHFLGGVTSYEHNDDVARAEKRGEKKVAKYLYQLANRLYGVDNWGYKMYREIEKQALS